MYYFGCLRNIADHADAGHYLYQRRVSEEPISSISKRTLHPTRQWMYSFFDGTFCRKGSPLGKADIVFFRGTTSLNMHDSSGDSRSGSVSVFIRLGGPFSFDEMLASAKLLYPEIVARIETAYGPITEIPWQ